VTFIERDRRAQALIAENLAHCGVTTGYAILRTSALEGLESLRGDAPYDAILLDPPYAQNPAETLHMLNAAGQLVAAGGLIVLEHARRTPAPEAVNGAVHVRDVRSGDSVLSFYEPPRGR
jgi:16S rRNA G966 N2-methylase RsmD